MDLKFTYIRRIIYNLSNNVSITDRELFCNW